MDDPAPFRRALAAALPDYGVEPTAERLDRLGHYLAMLAAWNQRTRLVGRAEPELLARRHVGESLFLHRLIPLAGQTLLDLGSGAGFPGLALQLAFPDMDTTLVESKQKKAAFLAAVTAQMGMGRVCAERLEALQVQAEIVTVRAIEGMEQGPERFQHLLISGGKLALWINRSVAESWRGRFLGWHWQSPALLPGASERAILVGERR
ncbi:MAG: 16S rRNA (guanine(527)-N(7))-methyltransferase RsmG [Terriglobales bacterium]